MASRWKTPGEEEKNDEDNDTKNNSNTANNEKSTSETYMSGNFMNRENSPTGSDNIYHFNII
ncbi:hypothetical protein RNJ44_01077 [Nakaseomyces bracarensis]|uniref:Uncharacterized protein n=1 Tax=Nakaseomyces bracarensis TaxID=273131 RepID=A0ABR4NQU8_9SACH